METTAVILNRGIIKNDKGEILLVQRSKKENWGAGKWELPGGTLKEGVDIDSAFEREILEETGLFSRRVSPLVFMETEIDTSPDSRYSGKLYITLVGETELVGGKLKITTAHQAYKWAKPKNVFDYDLTNNSHKALATFLGSE